MGHLDLPLALQLVNPLDRKRVIARRTCHEAIPRHDHLQIPANRRPVHAEHLGELSLATPAEYGPTGPIGPFLPNLDDLLTADGGFELSTTVIAGATGCTASGVIMARCGDPLSIVVCTVRGFLLYESIFANRMDQGAD